MISCYKNSFLQGSRETVVSISNLPLMDFPFTLFIYKNRITQLPFLPQSSNVGIPYFHLTRFQSQFSINSVAFGFCFRYLWKVKEKFSRSKKLSVQEVFLVECKNRDFKCDLKAKKDDSQTLLEKNPLLDKPL